MNHPYTPSRNLIDNFSVGERFNGQFNAEIYGDVQNASGIISPMERCK